MKEELIETMKEHCRKIDPNFNWEALFMVDRYGTPPNNFTAVPFVTLANLFLNWHTEQINTLSTKQENLLPIVKEQERSLIKLHQENDRLFEETRNLEKDKRDLMSHLDSLHSTKQLSVDAILQIMLDSWSISAGNNKIERFTVVAQALWDKLYGGKE